MRGQLERLTLAMVVTILASAPALAGGWDVDLRGGFYIDDVDGPFVGGGALKQISDTAWFFNPNVELAFGDDLDLITINGDVHYDFDTKNDKLAIWVGGGPALLKPDPNDPGRDDDLDLGLNGFAGLGAKRGNVRPFGQVKIIIADETELVVMGGVRF